MSPLSHSELESTALGKPDLMVGRSAFAAEIVQPSKQQVMKTNFPRPKGAPPIFCPDQFDTIWTDVHDGDLKRIKINGELLTISPADITSINFRYALRAGINPFDVIFKEKGQGEAWKAEAIFDRNTCSAMVDFNVPGKPNPPPVPLRATVWYTSPATNDKLEKSKVEMEFTDPSGTISKDPGLPLNRLVTVDTPAKLNADACPNFLKGVFEDVKDGDMKKVEIEGSNIKISPYNNEQSWVVQAPMNFKKCTALLNFNVPGKPDPPPVDLQVTVMTTESQTKKVKELRFTDPSATLAKPSTPLNQWVQIGKLVTRQPPSS